MFGRNSAVERSVPPEPKKENIEHPTSNAQHPIMAQTVALGYWLLAIGCWMLDVGCSMFDVRCWMFDVGCSMLDVRCWMFDVGCWMFDVGCWMFGPSDSTGPAYSNRHFVSATSILQRVASAMLLNPVPKAVRSVPSGSRTVEVDCTLQNHERSSFKVPAHVAST